MDCKSLSYIYIYTSLTNSKIRGYHYRVLRTKSSENLWYPALGPELEMLLIYMQSAITCKKVEPGLIAEISRRSV